MSTINLHGNAARFGTAEVIAQQHGFVVVTLCDESTRLNVRLEVNPDTARALAAALLEAADVAGAAEKC